MASNRKKKKQNRGRQRGQAPSGQVRQPERVAHQGAGQGHGPAGGGTTAPGTAGTQVAPNAVASAPTANLASPAPRSPEPPSVDWGAKLSALAGRVEALQSTVSPDVLERLLDTRLGMLRREVESAHEEGLEAKARRWTGLIDRVEEAMDEYTELAVNLPTGAIPVLRQTIEAREAELRDEKERRNKLMQEHLDAQALNSKLQLEVDRLRSDEGRVLREDLDTQRRELAGKLERLAQAEVLETENAELKRSISLLREQEHEYASLVRNVEEGERVATQLQEKREEVEQLYAQRGSLTERTQRLQGVNRQLQTQLDQQRTELTELREYEVEKDTLEKRARELKEELAKAHHLSAAKEHEIQVLQAKCDQLTADCRKAEVRAGEAEEGARALVEDELTERFDLNEARRKSIHQGQINRLETEAVDLRQQLGEEEDRIDQLRCERDEARAQASVAREQFESQRAAKRTEMLAELQKQKGSLEEMVRLLEGRLDVLTEEEPTLREKVAELRTEFASATARRDAVKEDLDRLRRERDELRHTDLPLEKRLASLREAVLEPKPLAKVEKEVEWLQKVRGGIADAGFQFPDRLLYAFHTSLKTSLISPITVLAGISGTGKSELPRLFADLGGIHFLNVAVQPNWDSPEDLFGFFNYTDGRYRSAPLAQVLYQVSGESEKGLNDQLVLVLLDEMNIARVEYYFSELLSRLETRRGLHAKDEGWERAAVAIDAGAGQPKKMLFLDHNLLFVGTMNEDESTLMLTDKVKDRANVLTFPRPSSFHDRGKVRKVEARHEALARTTWESWLEGNILNKGEFQRIEDAAVGFNGALHGVGRAIGHRVFQALVAYVTHYPVLDTRENAIENAMSDAYALKLLPKLVGLETRSGRAATCLDEIERVLPNELRDAFCESRKDEYFTWQGSRELYESQTDAGSNEATG